MDEHKLYRSRTDRMIGGVCGGIARYFEMDPSVVRLLTVVLAIVGNAAVVIAYIVMWVVVPEEPLGDGEPAVGAPAPAAATVPTAAPASHAAPAPTAVPTTAAPAAVYGPPTDPQPAHKGARSGLIWFGVLLIVLGASLLVDRMLPGLNLWGFWPATLLGLFLIASGIRTMVTREEDD